jgi:bacteriorhodopsin
MADIDVVKKGSSTWLWIVIALVVLALILWYMMSGDPAPQTGLLLEHELLRTGARPVPTQLGAA